MAYVVGTCSVVVLRISLLLLHTTFQNALIQEAKWLPIALDQKAVWKVTQKNRCYCSAKSPPVWGLVCSHLWEGAAHSGVCVRVQGWLSGSDGLSQMKSYLYIYLEKKKKKEGMPLGTECKIDVCRTCSGNEINICLQGTENLVFALLTYTKLTKK